MQNIENQVYRGTIKSFKDKRVKFVCYYKIIKTKDDSILAQDIYNDSIYPLLYKDKDGIFTGHIMHDMNYDYYVVAPFSFYLNNGLVVTDDEILIGVDDNEHIEKSVKRK